MKKILSSVLATALAMGMAVSVSAADSNNKTRQGEVIGTINDVSTGTIEIIKDSEVGPTPRVFSGPRLLSFRANNLSYGKILTTKESGKLVPDYIEIGVIASFNTNCTVGVCYLDGGHTYVSTGKTQLNGFPNETATFHNDINYYNRNYAYVKHNIGRGNLSGTATFYGLKSDK